MGRDDRTIVRRVFDEVFNAGDGAAAHALVAADFVAHHPTFGPIKGPDGLRQMIDMLKAGFSDLHYDVVDTFLDGDRVTVRWVASGTHNGAFMGVASTHRPVTVHGIDIFRVAAGQCAEAWVCSDLLGLMRQIGAIPA